MGLTEKDITSRSSNQMFQFIEAIQEPLSNAYYLELIQTTPPKFNVTISSVTKNLRVSSKLTMTVVLEPKKATNYDKADKIMFMKVAATCALVSFCKELLARGVGIDAEIFLKQPTDEELEKSLDNKTFLN